MTSGDVTTRASWCWLETLILADEKTVLHIDIL